MNYFGLVWPFMWHFMVLYGRISYFLAVIDPNSFGLVHSKNSISGEGRQPQCFVDLHQRQLDRATMELANKVR